MSIDSRCVCLAELIAERENVVAPDTNFRLGWVEQHLF